MVDFVHRSVRLQRENYVTTVTCVKMSVLCLYIRLFGVKPAFARVVKFFMALVLAWGIAIGAAVISQQLPISSNFDLKQPQHRIHFNLFFTWSSITAIVLDLCIIMLPMPVVWRLQIRLGRKVALILIFALSLFAAAAGILRVHAVTFLDVIDPTWGPYFPDDRLLNRMNEEDSTNTLSVDVGIYQNPRVSASANDEDPSIELTSIHVARHVDIHTRNVNNQTAAN
ncbi:MAG: hypothetical protein Q9220_003319 [cf. Caloplaca sp. 1 TL-2023]